MRQYFGSRFREGAHSVAFHLLFFAFAVNGCSKDRQLAVDASRPDASNATTGDSASNAPEAAAVQLRNVCSGCATAVLDKTDPTVRFHHLHLNAVDPQASRDFYTKVFGAEPVRLNGKAYALWVAPMLLLVNEVTVAPPDTLEMGLDHAGRGSDDPVAWFDQATQLGVMGDPRQGYSATPTKYGTGVPPGGFTFVYVRGPGAERMEVYTSGTVQVPAHLGSAEEFQHVHFLTEDVDGTVAWYSNLLGLPANPNNGLGRDVVVDRVSLFFASTPAILTFAPTDDRPLGHLALSVSDLAALRARVGTLGIQVVSEPKVGDEGFRSFFVRAPDGVLLELVEAGPLE